MGGWGCPGASRESLGVSGTEDVRPDAARLKGLAIYKTRTKTTHTVKRILVFIFFLPYSFLIVDW